MTEKEMLECPQIEKSDNGKLPEGIVFAPESDGNGGTEEVHLVKKKGGISV